MTKFGYLRRRDDEHFVNFLSRILILPINQLTNILAHSNIRIILSYFIKPNLNNCNRRQARQITNNNYWHEKFCGFKSQIDKIQGKITTIKILDEKVGGKGLNLKAGDIYIGTDNGVYLIHGEIIDKIEELNFPVENIILDNNGNAYVTNNMGIIYTFTKYYGFDNRWGIRKTGTINTGNKVNIIKCMNEEPDEGSHIVKGALYIGTENGVYFINSDKVYNDNPYTERFDNLNFSIKDIILDHKGSAYVINNARKLFRLNLFGWGHTKIDKDNFKVNIVKAVTHTDDKDHVVNKAIYIGTENGVYFVNGDQVFKDNPDISRFDNLNFPIVNIELDGHGSAFVTNNIGEKYHLHFIGWSNDKVEKNRKKREISVIDDLEENNELQNTLKWNKNITDFINHEQHLPIDNKTNFVTNNVTSL